MKTKLLCCAIALMFGCGPSTPENQSTSNFTTRRDQVLTPSMSVYMTGSTVSIAYDGFPASGSDWISIAEAGTPATSLVQYLYLPASVSGTVTFSGLPVGNYEARAYYDWSGTLSTTIQQTATFSITAAASTSTVTTDASTYVVGAPVNVTYAGLTGSQYDWVGLAVQGSPLTSYITYVNAAGINGTTTFIPPGPGTYEVRAFSNGTYNLIASSAAFTVTAATASGTVTTDASTYVVGAAVTATYAGLTGSQYDWVALAVQGSLFTDYITYVNAAGINGTTTFIPPGPGTYEVRAFSNGTYNLIASSAAFTVTAATSSATVTTDASTYAVGAPVTATYAGLTGSQYDWVALAVQGSPLTSYIAYVNAAGINGTTTFTPPGAGTYEIRAFSNGTYNLIASSAPFTVGSQQLTTNASTYGVGNTIAVTYNGLPGNPTDWIAIAVQGSPLTSFATYVYAAGSSGTLTFTAPSVGTYEIRAFSNNSYNLIATSAAFTVTQSNLPGSVKTDLIDYSSSQPIVASYDALPAGSSLDWMTIAPAGSPPQSYGQYIYITAGQTNGTFSFSPVSAGQYVVRIFSANSILLLAESPVFTVQ